MKISTSLGHGMHIAKTGPREAAAMMKKAGFDGVDLGMTEHQTEPAKLQEPEWREKLIFQAEALKAEGLEVAQTHMPYYYAHMKHPGDGSLRDYEAFMMPGWLRSLEITAEIGCPVAVMHPYYREEDAKATFDGNLEFIGKLLPKLKEYGLKLAVENVWGMGYVDTNMSYPEDLLRLIKAIDDDSVGLCIDTGHANIFGIHIGNMARLYGKHLFALHVNGNSGKADSHTVPYSMSGWCENMDYLDFSQALKEIGYKGYYNLEIASGNLPAQVAQPFYDYAAAVAKALSDLAE